MTAADIVRRLSGRWVLESVEIIGESDQQSPFGDSPIGEVWYDATGHFAGQIMRASRSRFLSDDMAAGTEREASVAFRSYLAYFGTFEVEESTQEVVHHVQASLFPNWIGSNQCRRVRFQGEHLILETPPLEHEGAARRFRAVWKRGTSS